MASVAAAARERPAPAEGDEAQLLFDAVRAAGQARAVFSRADVAGQVAARLPADGRSAAQVVARVEELTDRRPGAGGGGVGRGAPARCHAAGLGRAVGERTGPGRGGPDPVPGGTWTWRWVRAGPGAAPHPALLAAGLDASQYEAARQLAGSGDFLTVLTAPAGAGKTHTLGAATAAWQRAGFRVIGLAPSARAAAELAAVDGRAGGHPGEVAARPDPAAVAARGRVRVWAVPDDRTVLLVDEASMASTLDLALLVGQARAGGGEGGPGR